MHKQKGISLVEFVLVIATIGFLVLLVANLPSSLASISRSSHQSIANSVANKQLEVLRKQGASNLSNGVTNFTDSSLNKLPNVSASYSVSDCPVTICTSQEPMKDVKVTITWKEMAEQKQVSLSTLIANQGLSQ